MLQLAKRRVVWLPTILGWVMLVGVSGTCILVWLFEGEAFLSRSDRRPSEVLVVEGWIGPEGVSAAAKEFALGGYRYVVTTSGMTGDEWSKKRWSYAQESGEQLVRMGIPSEKVIIAVPLATEAHRTFESAMAVSRSLTARGIHPISINVFTLAIHARRSQIVFEKALPADASVGVVPWFPEGYTQGPWWRSSNRAVDFLKETFGYLVELTLNSGRGFKSTHDLAPSPSIPST